MEKVYVITVIVDKDGSCVRTKTLLYEDANTAFAVFEAIQKLGFDVSYEQNSINTL